MIFTLYEKELSFDLLFVLFDIFRVGKSIFRRPQFPSLDHFFDITPTYVGDKV